ncbi:MAG: TetR/AcrR family transcriptional regulator [Phycisphaerales bacterium]|nr:MAG: TetR/AcrR family transcriptional regulator [Phycisphaerales bacterium]
MAVSQKGSPVGNSAKGVRDRLLDAAEELFSERGFDGTSVRELAVAAGCNVASVNYYFGGKEKLYEEVWRRHLLLLRDSRVASIDKVMAETGGTPSLEALLHSFAYAFIGPLVDRRGGRRIIRLMAREMIDPHLSSDMFGEEVIRPTLTMMQKVLSQACPGLHESKVPLVVFSLVGQLLHTIRIRAMLQWTDDKALAMFEPAEVVNHIVAFSAAGIRAYAQGRIE